MASRIGFTQTGRALRIDTPLGEDVLLLRAVSGHETISQLSRFQLDLLSEDDSIKLEDLLGQNVTIHIEKADGVRHFNGHISRFSQGTRDERFTHYQAEMVPWLWFLTRTADCRIFQNKTVPDIIQQIFKDLGFTDFQLDLYGSFRKWDYCVQYRETDFNFVSRLMEEEGIYYYVTHDPAGGKHTLVLANDSAAHEPCPGQAKARCEQGTGGVDSEDRINEWRLEQEFRPSAWAHTDFNFETPSTNLMVTVKEEGKFEIYDYPGSYAKRKEGDELARARLQETVAFKNRASGASNCRCFGAGYLVEVTDHYRKDVNQKWLMTAVHHQVSMGSAYGASGGGDEFFYTNTFECIPSSVSFRASRSTPKPVVQGCQTAIVVGPAGEEIYTDKYGRVKVQFHWDREGKRNESSSCWVRVSHPWAGKGWGGIHIPRIGQEVIVDFLEGDPDQPIIIGRVYHAENMPPWGLPGKGVVSGVKSNSTKGGGGYNEISLDDTKGNELIQVHAQFDQDIKVEHDERTNVGRNRTESVGNDETITIGHDRTEKVGNNETITIGVNRTEKVGANESITIGANRTESVGSNETVTVTLLRTHNVGVNDMLNVGAAQEVTVGGAQAITVGGARAKTIGAVETVNIGGMQSVSIGAAQKITVGAAQTSTIGADQSTTVGGGQTVSVAKDQSSKVGGGRTASVAKDDAITVGKTFSLTAADQITLTTGSSSIIMKKDGTIQIKGKDISIVGSGKINVKADSDVVIKGSKILEN